jgi:hypothetical protein
LYFKTHRKVFIQSAYVKKTSYYNPGDQGLGYGIIHHTKEIVARFLIGYAIGWSFAGYLYGIKKIEITPEV